MYAQAIVLTSGVCRGLEGAMATRFTFGTGVVENHSVAPFRVGRGARKLGQIQPGAIFYPLLRSWFFVTRRRWNASREIWKRNSVRRCRLHSLPKSRHRMYPSTLLRNQYSGLFSSSEPLFSVPSTEHSSCQLSRFCNSRGGPAS